MSKFDARYKHFTKKSLHIMVTLAESAELKKVLAEHGLTMQAVLRESIRRICDPTDNYMRRMINECVENKLLGKSGKYLAGDVENIYKLIEAEGQFGDKAPRVGKQKSDINRTDDNDNDPSCGAD